MPAFSKADASPVYISNLSFICHELHDQNNIKMHVTAWTPSFGYETVTNTIILNSMKFPMCEFVVKE